MSDPLTVLMDCVWADGLAERKTSDATVAAEKVVRDGIAALIEAERDARSTIVHIHTETPLRAAPKEAVAGAKP